MMAARKACLAICPVALVIALIAWAAGSVTIAKGAGCIAALAFPIGVGAVQMLKGYQFTAWIVTAVSVPLLFPGFFLGFKLTEGITINFNYGYLRLFMIQLVMFGMGTQMSLRDFAGVARMPHAVGVGLVCQFTIMPVVGYLLGKMLGFDPEIAAGLVLIGSCSSGLASNVMAHMGRLNLPLSITLTACATALAPFITPLWLTTLGPDLEGDSKQFQFVPAMMSIFKIVVAPIGAAMIHDLLKRATSPQKFIVYIFAAIGVLWLLFLLTIGWQAVDDKIASVGLKNFITVIGFMIVAVLFGALYHQITLKFKSLDDYMPAFSMAGIIYFTAIATAAGRNELLVVGLLLCLAAIVHNTIGYLLGYWLSRLLFLKPNDARTVAMEVGMQNGGMAFGIASDLGKLATLGLAAAIFSPWMNISGSILANYWKKHPVEGSHTDSESPEDPAPDTLRT